MPTLKRNHAETDEEETPTAHYEETEVAETAHPNVHVK